MSADCPKHVSIILSFSFGSGNMISGDDEGGNWTITKRKNIQSRRDNKRENERQLWMAGCPWGDYAVIMLERGG